MLRSRRFTIININYHLYYQCNVAGTYGEITSSGIRNCLKRLDIRENDIFYDLGSGTGKVVTQFAYETKCKSCNGIELGERRYRGSANALAAMQMNGDTLSDKITFIKGNILESIIWHNATILFINAVCFPESLWYHD